MGFLSLFNYMPTVQTSSQQILTVQTSYSTNRRKSNIEKLPIDTLDKNTMKIRKDTKNSVFSFIDVPVLVVIDKLTWF